MTSELKLLEVFFKDKNKKGWLRIFKELLHFAWIKKEIPIDYIRKFLYRKEITDYKNYSSLKEYISIIESPKMLILEVASISDNKLSFSLYCSGNKLPSPNLISYNLRNTFFSNDTIVLINTKSELHTFFKNVLFKSNKKKLKTKMKLILSILEYLRFVLFWFLDILKGAKINRHYRDISFILENFSSSKSKTLREKSLKELLNHANKNTIFYKDFIKIEDFPVINKNILRAHIKEFKSSRFTNKKTRIVSTSGSTGSALKINQNRNKVIRNMADSIYFGKLAGFKIGYKLLYLRHWDDLLRKSLFTKFAQNIEELEVVNLNDSYIESILSKIKNDQSSKGWLGYASGYELICKYLDKTKSKPINSYVKSIIAMSEGLNKYTKKSMRKYFNADVISRYSNTENGIIAQQKINSESFTINWASFYVEIFKLEDDNLAKNGEVGRIVVTDLHNYAIPLIRYDTGDVGTIDDSVNPPMLKNIEGRKADVIYNTKGEIVSSFIVANVVEYEGIMQGQLIQETQKNYLLKLNVTNEFKQEVDIINEFKGYLGNDAKIKIGYVDEIPLLASGKRKATINNHIKKRL